MPRGVTGHRPGRPEAPRLQNCHGVGCECCGTMEATAWRCAPPDDGAPIEPLRPWRWYCSGEASGGTKTCRTHSNRAGAVANDGTDPRSIYDVLGLPASASASVIKTAYRRLVLQMHPDKVAPEERAASSEKFKVLQAAYDLYKQGTRRLCSFSTGFFSLAACFATHASSPTHPPTHPPTQTHTHFTHTHIHTRTHAHTHTHTLPHTHPASHTCSP